MNTDNMYDAVIVGGGPAGLTAAIYLARARYRVLVVEKEKFGGQITITSEVVNYPGTGKISGTDLTEMMRMQGSSFGAEYLKAEVLSLDVKGDIKTVHTNSGDFDCFCILVATGAHPRMIGFPGEEEYKGRGVAYCATCDGEFFTGKEIFVVGGGFAAAQESVFLTKYAGHVTILVREEDFTCAASTADEAKNNPAITVLYNTQVVEVKGDGLLRSITYHNSKTGKTETYSSGEDTFGVFVFAGYEPVTEIIRGLVKLDAGNYVITDRGGRTSLDGVYAAGDVCVKNLRQVATAVGDGAAAATEMEKYASDMQKKLGIEPIKPEKENKLSEDNESGIFTGDMKEQLRQIFAKMENSIILEIDLDDRDVSRELEEFINELASLTDKLDVRKGNSGNGEELPCVRILRNDGSYTGLAFHGIPGGHEFTSFVLGIYNASGGGQPIEEETANRIRQLETKIEIRVVVSLSCSMCPETVTSAQKIASMNNNVSAEVYDIGYFEDMKTRYNIMSVPCMIIKKGTEEKVEFGKKNVEQVLAAIG